MNEIENNPVFREAPAEEPARQLYFMELCRAWVEKKRKEEPDFSGTFHIQTFGCPTV